MILKTSLIIMQFLCIISVCKSQSKIKANRDSIVYEAFEGDTNDRLYWDNKKYSCSESPLSVFNGYESLYPSLFTICFNTYMNIRDDKQYVAIWIIIDDYLYLCDIEPACEDIIYIPIEDYCKAFQKNLTFNDIFRIKMIPVEELTGRKFQKKFSTGIYTYPMETGYVIPANWFNGIIDIKVSSSNYFAPYQRLVFKAGKVISVQNMIYYEWDDMKKTIYENSVPTFLKKPE